MPRIVVAACSSFICTGGGRHVKERWEELASFGLAYLARLPKDEC
jgi:hypothetical protein